MEEIGRLRIFHDFFNFSVNVLLMKGTGKMSRQENGQAVHVGPTINPEKILMLNPFLSFTVELVVHLFMDLRMNSWVT